MHGGEIGHIQKVCRNKTMKDTYGRIKHKINHTLALLPAKTTPPHRSWTLPETSRNTIKQSILNSSDNIGLWSKPKPADTTKSYLQNLLTTKKKDRSSCTYCEELQKYEDFLQSLDDLPEEDFEENEESSFSIARPTSKKQRHSVTINQITCQATVDTRSTFNLITPKCAEQLHIQDSTRSTQFCRFRHATRTTFTSN
eukprot:GHVP01029054.1.p1 GENE.GHVP01029054.1~~GHVP01029054.1.p1  ORF type:complete len:198 (-),score=21.82 GHVP01029054.1:614-1207(-)